MGRKSCGIPPKDRSEFGKICENNQKKKYEKNGFDIYDLPQNAGADFAAVKDDTIILVEAKSGSGKQSSNQKNTQNEVERNGDGKRLYEIVYCDCKGNPLPKE